MPTRTVTHRFIELRRRIIAVTVRYLRRRTVVACGGATTGNFRSQV
jgi:hypothetical protein